MTAWLDELQDLERRGEASIVVTISEVRGSSPREVGAKMIVTRQDVAGSIGGGQLEYQCTKLAVDMLREDTQSRARHRFPLGPSLGQCCGGIVDVLFEHSAALEPGLLEKMVQMRERRIPFIIATSDAQKLLITTTDCSPRGTGREKSIAIARKLLHDRGTACSASDGTAAVLLEPVMECEFNVAVFGAGHVGSAIVQVLSGIDCNVRWIDSRRNVFPARPATNVLMIESTEPAREAAAMPAHSHYLVLTHSHPLDYEICCRVLQRGDFAYLGLIGSRSKRRRFERLMRQQDMSQSMLERLTCPIGVRGIDGKKPQEIAIAATAQMLQIRDATAVRTEPADDNLHVM